MLIEINRNHYINLKGKWFEPVKCLRFYMTSYVHLAQCNEMVML